MTVTLLMLALKSLLVAAATLGLLRLTRKRSAAERSTVAHLGLFALVALPLASLMLPALSVTLPETIAPAPAPVVASALPPLPSDPAALPALDAPATPFTTPSPAVPDAAGPLVAPLGQPPSVAERAATLARYAYALPALALLMLTGIALARLVTLRARSQVLIDPHWVGALARAQHRMGFKSGTALLTSGELRSPISWGLLRPTILVNEDALASREQAEAILAHELAHVIHGDWAKLMLSRIATAVFWFNPLAWVLAREAHQLREESADDAVLAASIAGTDYAALLVGVARHENRGLLLGAHGVAPSRNSLRRRVARVLDKTPARGPSGRSWVAGFTAGMMAMAAPLAAVSFGTARAQDDAAAAVAPVAAMTTSWSTRAGEAPNQLLSEPERRPSRQHSAALARAVDGLDDDASFNWSFDSGSIPAADPEWAASMAEWGAKWGEYGAAIGERYAEAFAAMPPVPAVRPMPKVSPAVPGNFNFDFSTVKPDRQYSDREIDAMVGVTDSYRKEIAEAGFPKASRGELLQARSLGVTGEYIADMRKAGVNGPLATFAQARAQRVTSNFVESLRDAGISGSLDDYAKARAIGVTGAYVEALREAGLSGSLDDYAKARALGVTSGYVAGLAGLGVRASIDDYGKMRALGITTGYVAALHRNGTMITDPKRLIEIRTKGWPNRDRSDDP